MGGVAWGELVCTRLWEEGYGWDPLPCLTLPRSSAIAIARLSSEALTPSTCSDILRTTQ